MSVRRGIQHLLRGGKGIPSRVACLASALIAASGILFLGAPQASASLDTLDGGYALHAPGSIFSPAGDWMLTMQLDGNLVLYDSRHSAVWASGTNGNPGADLEMQDDGNLVVYGPGHVAIWASNTRGHPGSDLELQDDGNLVIYAPGHVAIWASNTAPPPGTMPTPRVGAPSAFNPTHAAAFALVNYEKVSKSDAIWRSSIANHCTEFVSTSLYAGGMPTDDTWWPYWQTSRNASFIENLKNFIRFYSDKAKPQATNPSLAWDNYRELSDYFVGKWYATKIDLTEGLLESGFAYQVGANTGDVIIYDWSGNGDSNDGHAAIVTGFNGTNVTVTQQGGGDDHGTDRIWNWPQDDPNTPLVRQPGHEHMKAWLLHWTNNARI